MTFLALLWKANCILKQLILVAILTIILSNSKAQVDYHVGLSLNNELNFRKMSPKPLYGYCNGPMLGLKFCDKVYVQTGLLLSFIEFITVRDGQSWENFQHVTERGTVKSIFFPLFVKFKITKENRWNPLIEAGFSVQHIFYERYESVYVFFTNESVSRDNYQDIGFVSLSLGVARDLNDKVELSLLPVLKFHLWEPWPYYLDDQPLLTFGLSIQIQYSP